MNYLFSWSPLPNLLHKIEPFFLRYFFPACPESSVDPKMTDETKTVKSACRMCHGVCQVLVHLERERIVKITADNANRGYIGGEKLMRGCCPELIYVII